MGLDWKLVNHYWPIAPALVDTGDDYGVISGMNEWQEKQ
jgi:hypothetical protein